MSIRKKSKNILKFKMIIFAILSFIVLIIGTCTMPSGSSNSNNSNIDFPEPESKYARIVLKSALLNINYHNTFIPNLILPIPVSYNWSEKRTCTFDQNNFFEKKIIYYDLTTDQMVKEDFVMDVVLRGQASIKGRHYILVILILPPPSLPQPVPLPLLLNEIKIDNIIGEVEIGKEFMGDLTISNMSIVDYSYINTGSTDYQNVTFTIKCTINCPIKK